MDELDFSPDYATSRALSVGMECFGFASALTTEPKEGEVQAEEVAEMMKDFLMSHLTCRPTLKETVAFYKSLLLKSVSILEGFERKNETGNR